MKFTEERMEFLKSFKGEKNLRELAELLKEKYGFEVLSLSYFRKRLRKLNIAYKYIKTNSGTLKKGTVPWNKGIKTNIKPKNFKKLKSERIDKNGYILIKVKNPDVWELKHRFLWKEVNGEIPKSHVIIFADGDKTNFSLKNLLCISKNELRQLNRYKLKKNNAELTKIGVSIVRLKSKTFKLKEKK